MLVSTIAYRVFSGKYSVLFQIIIKVWYEGRYKQGLVGKLSMWWTGCCYAHFVSKFTGLALIQSSGMFQVIH